VEEVDVVREATPRQKLIEREAAGNVALATPLALFG
jgi:hypothetical protein